MSSEAVFQNMKKGEMQGMRLINEYQHLKGSFSGDDIHRSEFAYFFC